MAKYYQYIIKAMSPVRIADDATSQSGQTDTLSYIPGSTIRGLVISALADQGQLDQYKKPLFSDQICFLNAYLTTGDHALIPSPKGFYESKKIEEGEKKIENVLINGEITPGWKRASLGRYAYFGKSEQDSRKDAIYYYPVATGSDLKIKIRSQASSDQKEQSVFRNEYIQPGQVFQGYVRLDGDKEELNTLIEKLLEEGKTLHIGNGRSAGLGRCKVLTGTEISEIPFHDGETPAENECYMMLLSDCTMRNADGEYTGLNIPELEKKLGVTDLQIKTASTSMRTVRGYNRTVGSKLPGVPMYAAGSIFHLTFNGTISRETLREIADKGLGVRKNEGFGRVKFLKNYTSVQYKHPCEYTFSESQAEKKAPELSEEDLFTLRAAAKGYYHRILEEQLKVYVLNHRLSTGSLSSSQLGTFRSILTRHQYVPEEAKRTIDKFFEHAKDKEQDLNIQKAKASFSSLKKEVDTIYNQPLEATIFAGQYPLKEKGKVFGISVSEFFTKEDEDFYKLKLLVEMIRFTGKKEGQHGNI